MKKETKSSLFKSAGTVARVSIAGIIIAVLIVSFYAYVSRILSSTEENSVPPTELETVLAKDFIKEYPDTPKKVIEWYNRILTLYYVDDVSDSDIEKLCDQARMLMSQEILDSNTRMNFIAAVKQERERYRARSKRIITSSVTTVGEGVVDGRDVASVIVRYTTQENSAMASHFQTYNLKKDGMRRYRIYSFALTDENGNQIIQ